MGRPDTCMPRCGAVEVVPRRVPAAWTPHLLPVMHARVYACMYDYMAVCTAVMW